MQVTVSGRIYRTQLAVGQSAWIAALDSTGWTLDSATILKVWFARRQLCWFVRVMYADGHVQSIGAGYAFPLRDDVQRFMAMKVLEESADG